MNAPNIGTRRRENFSATRWTPTLMGTGGKGGWDRKLTISPPTSAEIKKIWSSDRTISELQCYVVTPRGLRDMASVNGTHPTSSALCSSLPINVAIANNAEARAPAAVNVDGAAGRGGFDNFYDLLQSVGYSNEDGACGPMPIPACEACPNGRKGSVRCQECNQVLCNICTTDHMMASYTKDHYMIKLTGEATVSPTVCPRPYPSPNSSPGSVRNGHSPGNSKSKFVCETHKGDSGLYCKTCKGPICTECTVRGHPGHAVVFLADYTQKCREENEKLLQEVKSGMEAMRQGRKEVENMTALVTVKSQDVVNKIQTLTQNLKLVLEARERELISKVHHIRTLKTKSLNQQLDELNTTHHRLQVLNQQIVRAFNTNTSYDLVSTYEKVTMELNQVRGSHVLIRPCEDDVFQFAHPDQSLCQAITKMGVVNSSGYARNTIATGRGKTRARTFRFNTLSVQVHDHLGERIMPSPEQEPLTAQVFLPSGQVEGHTHVDRSRSGYVVRYKPHIEGPHSIHVKLRGRHIMDSPFLVNVVQSRDYTRIGPPLLLFGEEGGADGQVCRPWGVCCDLEANILVADRSNNRILIFRPDGSFYHKFGQQGSEPGQFDRPAGIASDSNRRIVVSDKDNHRIQVFKAHGEFLFMFGEKGSKNGQFNYPWDVDINSEGRMVVSDTRNHRVQLFTANGNFLLKFGFENQSPMWKHFDSPRGVAFDNDGQVIVTDFNNHRLVVLSSELTDPRFLGSEGSGPKEFTRPQGVCIDEDGHIIVADSRNHRIQIFEPNGSQLRQFGSHGINPGELDRPSGICVSPDGRIIVVDFGNSRIQAF